VLGDRCRGHVVAHPEKNAAVPLIVVFHLICVMMIQPYRRRGYAHRDLASKFLCRTFRGGNGLVLERKLLIIAGALDELPPDSSVNCRKR